MSQTPAPIPVQVARDVADEAELRAIVLDAIEDSCSSLALDDEGDRERAAANIAAALASRGVRP